MKIFANHAHVFREEVRPHGSVESLLKMLGEAGIWGAVAFAPFAGKDSNQVLGPEDNQNRWLAKEIEPHANLVGFGTVNFERADLSSQVKEMAGLGLKGIKIHPAYQKVKVNGKEAFEVYEAAAKNELFITFHTGIHWHRLADYNQLLFDEVAWAFPELRFSLEHIGGYCFFKESVAVMTNQRGYLEKPRIFAGWTSIFERGIWQITPSQLLDLIYMTGENAHIFGLDFPYKNTQYVKNAIEMINELDISDEAKEKILGKNLATELGIQP